MGYTVEETLQYVMEEDVKFIRLAFVDIFGRQKNISIMPNELPHAFKRGIAVDASAIEGFGGVVHSDLLLHPDPSTLAVLPWRPEHGKVVRMFCTVTHPDGKPFYGDTRSFLINAVKAAEKEGYSFRMSSESEFYLFGMDEQSKSTGIPYDDAGYMDISPLDRGENVRREICLYLENMGVVTKGSYHAEGPGQNDIDLTSSSPLKAADDVVTFRSVVSTVALRNGLVADFSPKPTKSCPGNGFHVGVSVEKNEMGKLLPKIIAGILNRVSDITLFTNCSPESYLRLGANKAPKYITWSSENRSQLIRIPAPISDDPDQSLAELRSPDSLSNPYLVFGLMIYAGLEGLKTGAELPLPADIDLYSADESVLKNYRALPRDLDEAARAAKNSGFISEYVPGELLESYCKRVPKD